MVWKTTGRTGGSSTQFGGQDLDKVSNLFSGVADVDTVDINSNWSYRNLRARIRNPANTFNYIINSAAIVADRNISLPLLGADDTFLFAANTATVTNKSMSGSTNTFTNIGDSAIAAHTSTKITITDRTHLPTAAAYLDTAQAFTAAQKFDLPIKCKPVTTPTTDASYGQFFSNSGDANKPYFVLPSGTAYSLTATSGTGGTPVIYDSYPATYDINTDAGSGSAYTNQLSPNNLWRVIYRGQNPNNPAEFGQAGVRVPSSPTGGFARVFYAYPYTTTNTTNTTDATLTLSESSYGDFDATFYMRTVAQKKTTFVKEWETAWFMWHFSEAGYNITQSGAHFHHYYLVLKTTGKIEVGRKDTTSGVDFQYFIDSATGAYGSEPTFTWAINTWYKIRVRQVSNHIQVWVDDVLKVDAVDDGTWGTPNTDTHDGSPPHPPSSYMYYGKFGLYNEDANTEWGPITVTDLSGGAGAPATASYVTLATDTGLSAERVLTAGNGITVTDAGAGSTVTVAAKHRVLNRLVTEQDVVNTVTETDILNYSVAGGTLGTDKAIRVTIHADHLNNSGGTSGMTFKVKYGATTMYQDTTGSFSANASRRSVNIQFTLFAKNSATSQGVAGSMNFGIVGGATTGVGDLGTTDLQTTQFVGANAAENSAVAKTLSLTVTHANAASTISFRRLYAVVEVLD